jgi:hypothetical protein
MSNSLTAGVAKGAKQHASVAAQIAGRVGYAAKGIVYAIVGVLATMAAWGAGGETTDTHGAMAAIAKQPFGGVLLWAMAIGLGGYCVWRFIETFADTERKGTSAKGLLQRAGFLISGIVYGLLGYEAAAHHMHGEGDAERTLTAAVMSWPGGHLLAALAGIGVLVYGLYQIWQSYTGSFLRQFKSGDLNELSYAAANYSGRFGLAARGLIFAVIGGFVVVAALKSNPGEAKGIGDALDFVASQPLGPWLLLAVALGLVAYGFYCLVRARYRSFEVESLGAS